MEIEPGYKHYDEDQALAAKNLKSVSKLEELEKYRESNLTVKDGDVEFKNVSARYLNGKNLVTRNVSFKIPKGTKVGVVGRTGSGKSTLIKLLWRYLDVEDGEILIDGTNI